MDHISKVEDGLGMGARRLFINYQRLPRLIEIVDNICHSHGSSAGRAQIEVDAGVVNFWYLLVFRRYRACLKALAEAFDVNAIQWQHFIALTTEIFQRHMMFSVPQNWQTMLDSRAAPAKSNFC